MPSFTTIYRAVVMVAAGVIVVKGWQAYGLTTDQVKAIAMRALEMAQTSLNNREQRAAASATLAADPRVAGPPLAAAEPHAMTEPPPLYAGTDAATAGGVASLTPEKPAGGSLASAEPSAPVETDRLPALLARLEKLGVADPHLAAWGSSGQLYRFCCRAALSNTPAHARHFEAVAAEPVAAVEQVVAKVEAWRMNQGERTALR